MLTTFTNPISTDPSSVIKDDENPLFFGMNFPLYFWTFGVAY
jgi:hypothetical protein